MSQDGSWYKPPPDPEGGCLSDEGICNACGDPYENDLLSDGRCARCHRNGNPPHSWCDHPTPR